METPEEYLTLFEKLSYLGEVKDVFKNHHKFHPYTFGYNGENLKHYDQVLTAKEDVGSFQTLDYIFEISVIKDKEVIKHIKEEVKEIRERDRLSQSRLSELEKHVILEINNEANNKFESSILSNKETSQKEKMQNGNLENMQDCKLEVEYSTSEVEYFLISNKPYQQLSDHFGLSVNLKYSA
jgi:hypothetical protein